MLAAVLHGINQKIVLEDRPPLIPAAGHSVVKVQFAALNHRDLWIQQGQYAGLKYPIVLGSDGMGIFEGKKVIIQPGMDWGDHEAFQSRNYRILGLPDDGTFATEVHIPTSNIFTKPEHLSDEEAAALPLAGLTAFRAVFIKAQVEPGDSVLITGIGGGVATLAMQMALAAGADVYVTSGSNEKIQQAMALGAKGGVNYHDTTWPQTLKKLSGGIHKVIDGAAGRSLGLAIECLQPGGVAVNYGGTTGPIEIIPQRLFWNQATLKGTTMGSNRDFAAMLEFVDEHRIRPIVARVFPFDQVNEAFAYLKNTSQFGKVVLSLPTA